MRRLIITATLLAPTAASAGGYLVPNTDPRDLALGGSAVANQDGASAVFLNTAALAGQDGLDIGAALGLINNSTEWSDPSLGSAKLSEMATPPAVAVAIGGRLPENQAWGIGLGFGVPAGGSLGWPEGWAGRESIQSVKTQVFGFGGGFGIKLLPGLKLGISYSRLQATEELHQSLNYLDHFGDAGLSLSGGANTFGLAGEFRIPQIPELTLGVTYSHAAEIELTGDIHFTEVPPAFQPIIHDQGVSEVLIIPDVVYAGLAYEAMPGLKLMGSYSLERFSDYKSDHFVGTDGFVSDVPRNYNDAHVIGVAGEWRNLPALPILTARAGIVRSISDQPRTTLSPSLTDASSWAISAGVGLDITPALRADAGIQLALFDEVTADTMNLDVFPGTYKTRVILASVGINWRTDLGLDRLK